MERELLGGGWEAVPLAGPLAGAREAREIRRRWSPVAVPGHWQLETNFAGYEGRVLYRRRFRCRPAGEGEALRLRFAGVYYAARVSLNGVALGGHEGYFSAFEFDVTGGVVDGENTLLVEVYSPSEDDENAKRTIGGVWAAWDGMSPYINPGGIFRGVEMIRSSPVQARSVAVRMDAEGRGTAFVDVYSREGGRVGLGGLVLPDGFDAAPERFEGVTELRPGITRVEVPFALRRPRTWTTWDRGEQALYRLRLGGAGEPVETVFGACSVELRGWHLHVNGERVFARGVNYLPADAYPARVTGQRYRDDAALVREANMNAVRVHAHVADPEFYRACDAMGLLVLQDFPLQWTHRRSVLGPAVSQAREMARGLRGHPSVGLYLAHDEPFYVAPPEKWSPGGLLRTAAEVAAPRWALWQRRVLDPAVVRAIGEEDAGRPVIDAAGHPLTTNHLYFGWYYGGFRDLERAVEIYGGLCRFPTEYGAQALPDPASLEELWGGEGEPDWGLLQSAYRMQVRRMSRYVPWRGDLRQYARRTQEYQAEVLRHATELFRRRKYRPTGGAFAFMLNDPAPAVSWSVVDWRRRPKAGLAALAAAMRPVLVCARYPREEYREGETLRLPLYAVNDLACDLGTARWSWRVLISGLPAASGAGTAALPADSVVELGVVEARLGTRGEARLLVEMEGDDGDVSENAYAFRVV